MKETLRALSLVDALRDALQRAIVTGEIPAGTYLTEQNVARQYDIARPTAKAAMEQLVRSGLLRRSLNRTARVPLLDADDIRDIHFSRGMVERAVVLALAANRTAPQGASGMIDRLRQATDVNEIVEADIEFHRDLVKSLGSSRAVRLHDSVIGEAHLCMGQVQVHQLLDPGQIADEHRGILEAITAGDSEAAAERMDKHLSRARDRLIEYSRQREA